MSEHIWYLHVRPGVEIRIAGAIEPTDVAALRDVARLLAMVMANDWHGPAPLPACGFRIGVGKRRCVKPLGHDGPCSRALAPPQAPETTP